MPVTGSNRFRKFVFNHPEERKTLFWMANDGSLVKDIEEGEISDDSRSLEEISEEGFKEEAKVSKHKGDSRVSMGDLLKYSVSSNYAPGLYNFAWAQAVKNKPFSEILMRDFGSDEKSKRSAPNLFVNSSEDNNNNNYNRRVNSVKEVCNVVIDDSSEEIYSRTEDVDGVKEEGELEEGEIELDSEMVEETEGGWTNNSLPSDLARNFEGGELEKRIKSILEALGTVTVKDAEKPFHGVCSEMSASLDKLQLLVMENGALDLDYLIQQSFAGIQAINSVLCSMNPKQQEQNKDFFSRLLSHVMSQDTALFSPEQMKEIETMMRFLDSQAIVSSVKAIEKGKEIQVNNGMLNPNELGILGENPGHVLNSSKKFLLEPIPVKSGNQNIANMGFEIKPGLLSGSRSRGSFGPLLDLHRDHDADSLPSPTRETPTPLPVQNLKVVGYGVVKSELATPKVADKSEDATMHHYETDTLKALSIYQQKFGRTSNILTSRLPSPTPSEDCDDVDHDLNDEVSSCSTVGNVRTVNPPVSLRPVGSPTPHMDSSSGQGWVPAKTVGQLASGSNHVLRAPAKSRDPRLRFANSEGDALDLNQRTLLSDAPKSETLGGIINSRKHKIIVESVSDGQTFKRKRNGLINSVVSGDVQMVSGSSGWLEDASTVRTQATDGNRLTKNMGTDLKKLENGDIASGQRQDTASCNFNVRTGGNEQLPMVGSGTMASLPSLLRDIAANPTMLMQLLMEQQCLAAGAQKKSSDSVNTTSASSSSVIPGTVPLVNAVPSKSLEIEKRPAGKPQVPAQTTSTNTQGERGQIRMKPRDPRRILHNSTFQKNESLGTDQFKTNGAPSSITQASKDNILQAHTTSLPSQSAALPDIAQQLTKKLKNLADILSTSQATNTPLTFPQSISSQPVPVKTEKASVGVVVTDSRDQQIGIGSTPEKSKVGPFRSQNPWGDVEQLFEGFDDQQKAAIQRERARRIEEQNKMFAARKLCLVLDLDHTLLNSAKFVEVDPVHDEILRKKEEQDREKPQRHLFHFPHMGMWTKLRPGIWNFLEKASKLYELHLYTMGNKLYAMEMAKVLDPTGVLFAGRVLSKGDDGEPFDGDEKLPKKKNLDRVLGMESAVVIIDDSVRVWPHNKLNLIVVERYTYFPCSRRQFGLLGPSLLEIDHDERPEDGTLASSLAVIERVHQNFFSHQSLHDVDVRNVLASEQRKILAGCRIVFSRVFPVGEANPQLHPLWQTAEQFGALCTNQIDEQVTHVVANTLGTDKVNWALSTGRFAVHPGWVEASALLYRRASEQDFAVKI